MSDSEGAEETAVNSDQVLLENGLHRQWTCSVGAEYEDSDEQTGNFQQRDASEEAMEDSDIEETAEASGSGETLLDGSSSSVHEPGRKKVCASEEHNRKERVRRQELKKAVDELRKQLRKPTKKASTISVLQAAQEEIQELAANKNKDEGTLDELKQIRAHLQLRLEGLKMKLQDKPTAPSFPLQMSPLSQLILQPQAPPMPHTFPLHMVPDGGRSFTMAPPMILVAGGLHPSSIMVPPPFPLPPSLVSIPRVVNTFPSPCPALIAPCLPPVDSIRLAASMSNGPPSLSPDRPPLEPCIYTPAHPPISLLRPPFPGISGLVGRAQIPHIPTLGGVGPSAGVFASLNSWTDNPANQRPYFPVTVFSHPPTCKLGNNTAMPPCPPLFSPSSLSAEFSQYSPHPYQLSSSHLSATNSAEAASQNSHLAFQPLLYNSPSLSTPTTQHTHNTFSSHLQRPPSPREPSHTPTATETSSRGRARKDVYNVNGYSSYTFSPTSPPHRDQEPPTENGSRSTLGGVAARRRRKTSPSNEDETDDEGVDYSLEKRARRGFCGSSSDSDSGGSCFSDQGRTRESTRIRPARRSAKRAASRSNSSERSNGTYGRKHCMDGKIPGGRCVPLLCPVNEGCAECVGASSKEASASVGTSDVGEAVRKRRGSSAEGVLDAVGESSTGRTIVVTGRCEERALLPACPPPLDSRPMSTTTRDEAWGKKEGRSTWMDEIVERSVNNFRKFLELSSTTAF